MTKKYGVIVYNTANISSKIRELQLDFRLTHCQTMESLLVHASSKENELVLIDVLAEKDAAFALLDQVKTDSPKLLEDKAFVLLTDNLNLDQRLMACELGADDCISTNETHDDLVTRLQTSIFNNVASRQLKEQLKAASDVAMAAMANTSDMGITIQFMLDSHQCHNFDELGQLLFQCLNHYGLTCSLQLRGKYKTKNMEASGLAKSMESKLLNELKGAGRFYDFGNRTVINFNNVSILIKNMPIEDPQKYGVIKDNVLALLQGADAKVEALDLQSQVYLEHQSQENLVKRLENGIEHLGEQYRELTKQTAAVVNQMADSFEQAMQTLLLTDEQEQILLDRLEVGKNNVYDIFEKFAHMDDEMLKIIKENANLDSVLRDQIKEDESNDILGVIKRLG